MVDDWAGDYNDRWKERGPLRDGTPRSAVLMFLESDSFYWGLLCMRTARRCPAHAIAAALHTSSIENKGWARAFTLFRRLALKPRPTEA